MKTKAKIIGVILLFLVVTGLLLGAISYASFAQNIQNYNVFVVGKCNITQTEKIDDSCTVCDDDVCTSHPCSYYIISVDVYEGDLQTIISTSPFVYASFFKIDNNAKNYIKGEYIECWYHPENEEAEVRTDAPEYPAADFTTMVFGFALCVGCLCGLGGVYYYNKNSK